jgi:hypothetical protein
VRVSVALNPVAGTARSWLSWASPNLKHRAGRPPHLADRPPLAGPSVAPPPSPERAARASSSAGLGASPRRALARRDASRSPTPSPGCCAPGVGPRASASPRCGSSDPPTVCSPPGLPAGAWVAPGGGSARLARGLRGALRRARSRAHTPPRGRPRALDGLVRSGTTRPVVPESSLAPLGRETALRCASCELGPNRRPPCLPPVEHQPASRRSPRGFGGGSPARAPPRFLRARPSRPPSGLPPPRGASSSLGCPDPRCVAAALGPSLTRDVGVCSDADLGVACAPSRHRALLRGLGDVAVLLGSSVTCTLTPAGSRGGVDRASRRALHRGVRAASPAPLAPRSGLSHSLLRRARQARPRRTRLTRRPVVRSAPTAPSLWRSLLRRASRRGEEVGPGVSARVPRSGPSLRQEPPPPLTRASVAPTPPWRSGAHRPPTVPLAAVARRAPPVAWTLAPPRSPASSPGSPPPLPPPASEAAPRALAAPRVGLFQGLGARRPLGRRAAETSRRPPPHPLASGVGAVGALPGALVAGRGPPFRA